MTPTLPAGSTVYAVVTAVTASGEGPPSPEVTLTLQSPPPTPGAPTDIVVTPGNGQLTLIWTASPNATSYVVYGARVPGVDKDTVGTISGGFTAVVASSPAVLPGLENDQLYFLRVAATNSLGQGFSPSSEVAAVPTSAAASSLHALTYKVIDAEYSRALNRIVAVSSSPSRLHLYNPLTQTDTAVTLSQVPKCVSVSPDGLTAVVGHDGYVSHVNLATATLLNTWSTGVDAFDVVLAGNGKAYVNPAVGQWVDLYAVTLSNGTMTSSGTIRHQSNMKLHASGSAIYSVTTDLSPSDVEKWDTSPAPLYDSDYHGDFPMGGPLWTSMDGAFLITRSATRFSTTGNSKQTDLRYQGRLYGLPGAVSVDHSSTTASIAAIPFPSMAALDDTRVQWFEDIYCEAVKARVFPKFDVSGTKYAAHGKFAFLSSDGSKVHVVVMADAASGLLNDYAVVTFD
jgi:hypothetical protein